MSTSRFFERKQAMQSHIRSQGVCGYGVDAENAGLIMYADAEQQRQMRRAIGSFVKNPRYRVLCLLLYRNPQQFGLNRAGNSKLVTVEDLMWRQYCRMMHAIHSLNKAQVPAPEKLDGDDDFEVLLHSQLFHSPKSLQRLLDSDPAYREKILHESSVDTTYGMIPTYFDVPNRAAQAFFTFSVGSWYEPVRDGKLHPRGTPQEAGAAVVVTYLSDIRRLLAMRHQGIQHARDAVEQRMGHRYPQGFCIPQEPRALAGWEIHLQDLLMSDAPLNDNIA